MKRTIPVYLTLVTILALGILMLRKAEAIRSELAGIRTEQLKQPVRVGNERPSRGGQSIPVRIDGEPLHVVIDR